VTGDPSRRDRIASTPAVSVVMVAYGRGWRWVARALDALHRNTAEPNEVILVDNGGADAGDRVVPEGRYRVVRNRENVGFGPASNQGAELARSPTICFLNTDVLVEPGWLSPLLEALNDGRTGAVFPAKLNLDGTMQEAGAFVTGEGLSYVFGDGEDPNSPEHLFPREVDFGSAACMCMTGQVFAAACGFDDIYRLAYYEDADLCFRLRQRGLRPAYEPRSRIRHARSVSAPASELNEVSGTNRRAFIDRWAKTVAGRPTLDELQQNPVARIAARDFHATERILVVDDEADGSAADAASRLATRHPTARVTLLTKAIDGTTAERPLAAGVEVGDVDDQEKWLANRRGHYSIVVRPGRMAPRLGDRVDDTQPRARYWPLERVR
jgi:GT2 family glycosyltransferase